MTMLIAAIVTVIAVMMFIVGSNMNTRTNVADMGSDANIRARGRCAQQAQRKYRCNQYFHWSLQSHSCSRNRRNGEEPR